MKTYKPSYLILGAALSLALLNGCSTMPEVDPAKDGVTEQSDRRSGGGLLEQSRSREDSVEVMPISSMQGLSGEALQQGQLDGQVGSLLTDEMMRAFSPIVYFAYDQFSVDEESMKTLKYYADQMLNNPGLNVTLEGHTDERGSPSYNLALGEKRAQAVAEVMMLYGIGRERMTLISFGEEQPAQIGHDEAVWSKNRRVELRF